MELKWSLKELYKSFDSEEFKSDLEKVDSLICNLNLWVEKITESKDNSIEKLEEYIDYYTDIENLVNRVGAFIHLTISADRKSTR